MMMRVTRYILLFITLLLAADAAAQSQRMAVASEVANIRSGPDTESEVLWQVERYYPLLVIEKKDPWYRFKDIDGHQGWIHKSLLDTTATVIVRVRRANLRSGPGTENAIVFDAEKGTPFKVLTRKSAWLEVQHADGDSGWIFKSLVW
jgi:SH3-like domain-containing protein